MPLDWTKPSICSTYERRLTVVLDGFGPSSSSVVHSKQPRMVLDVRPVGGYSTSSGINHPHSSIDVLSARRTDDLGRRPEENWNSPSERMDTQKVVSRPRTAGPTRGIPSFSTSSSESDHAKAPRIHRNQAERNGRRSRATSHRATATTNCHHAKAVCKTREPKCTCSPAAADAC